jgi:peptidoglycan L-alanyl-D-glutamate endopeptidase CwlK
MSTGVPEFIRTGFEKEYTNEFVFGKGSLENILTTKKVTQVLAYLALRMSTVDFSIIDGLRTTEQQQKLFAEGATTLDGVNDKSDHQSGLAIDIKPATPLDEWKVDQLDVMAMWMQVYRAFMRAAFLLGIQIEFGVGYNIGNGYDWPHISIKGYNKNNPLFK